MFRTVDFDFVCLACGKQNDRSKLIAGDTLEEAEQNVLSRSQLTCLYCHKPAGAETAVHFSRRNEL
jgi:hypothetical protein